MPPVVRRETVPGKPGARPSRQQGAAPDGEPGLGLVRPVAAVEMEAASLPGPRDAGWYRGLMSRSLLADAFGHHAWATLRLIDTCLSLGPEQLGKGVPGTYGSILETMRHLVGADVSYLFALTGGRSPLIDEDQMDLPELRTAMEANGAAWSSFLLAQDLDPDVVVVRHRADGT